MKKVEILTANTIPIQYETAPLLNRGVALLLDLLVMLVYYLLLVLLFVSMSTGYRSSDFSEAFVVFYWMVMFMLPVMFYSLIMEYIFKGQTVGKMVMGIRVVSMSGENASFNDYIMRWTFKIVDFWFSSGGIGAILISTSESSQRLGDILAQTIVIKTKSTQLYTINDILNIKTKQDYKPKYSGVVKFTDDDMIILKNTITRYKKYPNEAHKSAVIHLTNRLVEELNLPTQPDKKIAFLKDVLQDYIVLTR